MDRSCLVSDYPWQEKEDKAFFRVSRISGERDVLLLMSRSCPHLVDAQYTANQVNQSPIY